jgi:hypothetical protein
MTRPALTRQRTTVRAVAASLCTLLAVSACQSKATPPTGSTSEQTVLSSALPRIPYVDLVDTIAAHRAAVWVDVDLVKAWQAGPQRYADVLNIAVKLASRPGVVGIKIADELGYHDGIDTPDRARQFLAQASTGIRSRLPGTKILVDMIVPQLGCVAWAAEQAERLDCSTAAGNTSPAATIDAVDTYLASKTIDVLDLSAGLRDPEDYRVWKTTRDEAMRAVWKEVVRRQWNVLVTLQARKALAHAGSYAGDTAQAEQDLRTFVDIPLANGARAVDIWAWRQQYKGATYRLFDPGLHSNPLIAGLARRRAAGARLITNMTPSSLEVSAETDVKAATAIFGSIFVAAGAGSG